MFNERFVRVAVWLVAVILPGGLLLLAVWESLRALRARQQLRASTPPPRLTATASQPQPLGT